MIGVEDTTVAPASRDGLVFRAIHEDLGAFVRARGRNEIFHTVCTGDAAADPAAVETLVELLAVHLRSHLHRVRVASVLIIVRGKEVVIVHDGHQMGGSDPSHLILYGVQRHYLLTVGPSHRSERIRIVRRIAFRVHGGAADNKGRDLLVPENGTQSAPSRLFIPDYLPADIVPTEVQAAHERVFRPGPCGDDGNGAKIVSSVEFGQLRAHFVAVPGKPGHRFHGNSPVNTVDEHHDVIFALPLYLEGVESREFQIGAEITTDVRIDDGPGQWRYRGHYALSTAGIEGGSTEGTR